MFTLSGHKIAPLGNRRGNGSARFVRRLRGETIGAPAMNGLRCHDDFTAFLHGLTLRRFSIAIFPTGARIVAASPNMPSLVHLVAEYFDRPEPQEHRR